VTKSVRTFNASDEVSILIAEEAPKGRGFSDWVNRKIMKGELAEKNKMVLKSQVNDLRIKI